MGVKRNISYILVSQIFTLTISFISSIIISRYLGPHGRGVYFLIITTVQLISIIGNVGLGTAFVYFLGKGTYEKKEITGLACLYTIFASLITAFLLYIGRDIMTNTILRGLDKWLIWIIVIQIPSVFIQYFFTNIMIGLNKFLLSAFVNSVLAVISLGTIFYFLVLNNAGLNGIYKQMVLFSFISLTLYIIILVRATGVTLNVNFNIIKDSFSYGMKIFVGFIGYQVLNRLDMYILNYILGPASIGYYTLSTSLAEKIWLVDSSIGQAAIPKITYLKPSESAQLIAKVCRTSIFSMFIIALIVAPFSKLLITFLYGVEFKPSVVPFIILLPGVTIMGIRNVSYYFSMQQGRPGITTKYTILAGLLSIPVYLILTIYFGIIGAALASSFSYIITAVLATWYFKKATNVVVTELYVMRLSEIVFYYKEFKNFFLRMIK